MRQLPEFGNIFFLYTPKPGQIEVEGPDDVSELAFVLSPDGDGPARLVIVREKRLPRPAAPEAAGGEYGAARVVAVRERPEELVELLEARVQTKPGQTAGPWQHARPCGEGRYSLAVHDTHTHLSYGLELPSSPGPVQHALGLVQEASYRAAVRLPASLAPPGSGRAAPETPEYVPVRDPALLDLPGCELLLEAGLEPGLPVMLVRETETPATAEIFAELKLTRDQHPTKPLYRGEWC